MKEKLIIKNFGPIKSVELDLGRFNILIGEQATGKSTVAKVLAVCRYFSYIVGEDDGWGDNPFEEGLNAWGLRESIQRDSFIYYKCKHYSITIQRTTKRDTDGETEEGHPIEFDVDYFSYKLDPISSEFIYLVKELDNIKPKENNNPYDFSFVGWAIPASFFQNNVSKVMDNPFYLPAERGLQSIFSIGKSSIGNLSDALFNQFARMDGIARQFKKDTLIEPLNIYYQNRDGHGFIRKANETQYYSLYNAASGYQSTIPVALLMKYYTELRKKSKTLIIEEPELNLYPIAQYDLMKYLIEKTNANKNSLFIATHSPYILASINNLLLASKYGSDKVNEIIPEKYWLNINDVSAYKLLPNGEAEDIIDEESGQIKAEKIDGASQVISGEYEKIMDVAFS